MGRAVSDEQKKLQDTNLKCFDDWLSANRKTLVPKPNKAVIYAGFEPPEYKAVKRQMTSDPEMGRMWQRIEDINKKVKKVEGQAKYDLLNDVLKRCKRPPNLVDTQGPNAGNKISGISNMLDYATTIGSEKLGLIHKGKIGYIWDELSGAYVANSKGEVAILEGRTRKNKRVTIGFTMIRKELAELWKRKDLPAATRENAAAMISGYLTYYDGQAQMSKDIVKEAREVMRKARVARKGR